MKKINFLFLLVAALVLASCNQTKKEPTAEGVIIPADTADKTNDFYDNAETFALKGNRNIEVAGEVANPGIVDFSKMTKRSVIVKETIYKAPADSFYGAYRYDGYSVYDILNQIVLKKKNEEAFPPIIDLFVEIENDKGEKVVLSWGEIYYPIHRHEIIIATDVMRIVPSKTKELWTLPENTRLVVGSDLITARNISNPVKISVVSYPLDVPVQKGMKPLYSPEVKITDGKIDCEILKSLPKDLPVQNYPAIFYGRGKGIHSTQPFKGVMMKDILGKDFSFSVERLQKGLILAVAKDGYRGVFTYSEIMNRNDQSELLLIAAPEEKNDAVFKLYPAMDFFSDRAVKALTEIRCVTR
ncbi:MAG TPA: lipoprotein [Bacteroidales bacterium]|nr:lipoprotein [Bacteroidales bacterium]HQI69904.1 lipoprotein [Bacteroidales bacterium]